MVASPHIYVLVCVSMGLLWYCVVMTYGFLADVVCVLCFMYLRFWYVSSASKYTANIDIQSQIPIETLLTDRHTLWLNVNGVGKLGNSCSQTARAKLCQHLDCNYIQISLPNIMRVVKSRRMRGAGHVARMGEERGVHRLLVGKPEGKRPLGRPRRRWDGNIKMDLQDGGVGCGDWVESAQDRDRWRALVSTVNNLRVP
jgi:hypothetical protein